MRNSTGVMLSVIPRVSVGFLAPEGGRLLSGRRQFGRFSDGKIKATPPLGRFSVVSQWGRAVPPERGWCCFSGKANVINANRATQFCGFWREDCGTAREKPGRPGGVCGWDDCGFGQTTGT